MLTTHIQKDKNFAGLDYSQTDLQKVMREHYDKMIDFIISEPFKALIIEMSYLSNSERIVFIYDVLLNDAELARRIDGLGAPVYGALMEAARLRRASRGSR